MNGNFNFPVIDWKINPIRNGRYQRYPDVTVVTELITKESRINQRWCYFKVTFGKYEGHYRRAGYRKDPGTE